MMDELDFLPLKVVCVGPSGKRTFDPQGKRLLIEACRQPGASVAGLALKAGVNANQLRNWIALNEISHNDCVAIAGILRAPAAFVPVVEVVATVPGHDSLAQGQQVPVSTVPVASSPSAHLSVRLPNGVTMELQCAGGDAALVAAMVKALGAR